MNLIIKQLDDVKNELLPGLSKRFDKQLADQLALLKASIAR